MFLPSIIAIDEVRNAKIVPKTNEIVTLLDFMELEIEEPKE